MTQRTKNVESCGDKRHSEITEVRWLKIGLWTLISNYVYNSREEFCSFATMMTFSSSSFLNNACVYLVCCQMAQLGFFPNSYAVAWFELTSEELHQTGTFWTLHRLGLSYSPAANHYL